MTGVVADTHALIWYLVEPSRLSAAASAVLDQVVDAGEPIYVSAVSLIELIYLVEKGRLPQSVAAGESEGGRRGSPGQPVLKQGPKPSQEGP